MDPSKVNPLDTMDGVLWAREFCRLNPGQDEPLMTAWFCNAIMAGYDHARRTVEATPVSEQVHGPI